MPHAPRRSILPPFTRRGPPTEDEERKALEERRAASRRRQAAELPQPRSIPRTAFDPAHPTINPPGGRENGPRTQAELTAADEKRRRDRAQQRGLDEQNRLDRNKRLREAGLPEEELPSERAARGIAIKRDRMRREAQRREGLGLPPREDRGASIRHEAARIAVLDDDLSAIPRLIGSPESVARKARADPTLFRDQEIFRSTVGGQETFQRYNAGPGNFTRMRFDPVTNDFVVDLSTPERLSDADIKEAFGDLKTNIRDRIRGASPDEAGDLNSLLARVDAIEGFAASLNPSEIAKLIESTSDDVNRLTKPKEPPPPTIEQLVADGVHKNPDGSMFITGDIKHIPKPKEEKQEKEEPAPPTTAGGILRSLELADFLKIDKRAREIVADKKAGELAVGQVGKLPEERQSRAVSGSADEIQRARQELAGDLATARRGFGGFSEEAIIRAAKRRQINTVGRTREEIEADLIKPP